MRPTNPKPITPMPTRSLAPRTRFQDAAVNAAAADPLLMKLRRVNSCLGCCDVACNDWFIIQNEVVMTWRFPGHVRSVNERNRFSRLSRESRLVAKMTAFATRRVPNLLVSGVAFTPLQSERAASARKLRHSSHGDAEAG